MIVTTDNKNYQDIAGAIRKIGETDETYTPAEMANAILLASVNAHDLDDVDLSNKEEAYFLYDSKLDTDGIPRFVSLYAATNDGSQYSVSRGHVENNNFVADSTELVNSGTPFFKWLESGDVRYILYRVAPRDGSHIITIGQSDSSKDSSGNYYAYFSQPQIKRKSRLPYLSHFSNWRNSYVTKEETLDVSQVTSLSSTWQNCVSLVNLDLSGWDASQVTSLSSTWSNCASLVNLDLSGWDASQVTSLSNAWQNCVSLVNLDLSGWDVSQVTSLNYTWQNCASLVNLDLSGWDVSQVTSLSSTWSNCASLVNLDLSGWDASQVTSLNYTWNNCASLVNLDLSGWDASQVTSLSGTWNNCASLVNLGPAIIRANFSLSNSMYLTIDSLVAQLEALPTVTSPTTITIGGKNQSKLTEEQIKIATDKGWTVA